MQSNVTVLLKKEHSMGTLATVSASSVKQSPLPVDPSSVVSNGRESFEFHQVSMWMKIQLMYGFAHRTSSGGQMNGLLRESILPTLLEIADDSASSQIQKQEQLAARLHTAFEASPVEDGISHPGEIIIKEALRSPDEQCVLIWFKVFSVDAVHPDFAASVLRCLGRQERPGTVSWRVAIIREALSMDAVDIRDAAAQAAESWGGLEMRDVLQEHIDPAPWLQEYILDIIKDLSG